MQFAFHVCLASLIALWWAGGYAQQFGGPARSQYQSQGGGFRGVNGGGWVEQGGGNRHYRQQGGQDLAREGSGGTYPGSEGNTRYRTNLIDTPDSYGYEATYPGGRARYINHRSPAGSSGIGGGFEGRGRPQQQYSPGNRDQWNQ